MTATKQFSLEGYHIKQPKNVWGKNSIFLVKLISSELWRTLKESQEAMHLLHSDMNEMQLMLETKEMGVKLTATGFWLTENLVGLNVDGVLED